MPITPSYSWSETPAWVTVDVLLQSVSQSALDIITTECYIKVNCLPYLFQADLYGNIDTNKSSAMVDKSTVKFFMVKKTEGLWGRLTIVGDRKAILERRQQSLDAIRVAAQKTKAEAGAKISHIRRLAVGSQMKLEEVRRKTIEGRKEAELREERDALDCWQQELGDVNALDSKQNARQVIASRPEETLTANKEDLMHEWDALATECKVSMQEVHEGKVEIKKVPEQEQLEQKAIEKLDRIQPRCIPLAKLGTLKTGERILPAPRRSFRVSISFTPKIFPNHLPARESREKQLQLKKHSPISNDVIDVSEREPLFLQDKGDKFYSSGDFKSAINAYTDAIQKDASMFLCYANRAACYLQTNQLQASIDDCTIAVRLLRNESPEAEENSTSPVADKIRDLSAMEKIALQSDFLPLGTLDLLTTDPTAVNDAVNSLKWVESCIFSRRACAKCHQGDLYGAATDFREALNTNPSNKDIQRVLEFITNK